MDPAVVRRTFPPRLPANRQGWLRLAPVCVGPASPAQNRTVKAMLPYIDLKNQHTRGRNSRNRRISRSLKPLGGHSRPEAPSHAATGTTFFLPLDRPRLGARPLLAPDTLHYCFADSRDRFVTTRQIRSSASYEQCSHDRLALWRIHYRDNRTRTVSARTGTVFD